MTLITTKYIILIWIIILILFTFYCIFRLRYINKKYNNTNKEKYIDTSQYQTQTQTTNPNIYSYINKVQQSKNITDIQGCQNIYDDNLAVQSLGYSSCENAYNDYLTKNLDVTNNYGQQNSLTDICPVSCKSPIYSQCLQNLLLKYTNNSGIVDNITSSMTDSINARLNYRNTALDTIKSGLNPLINNKDQIDFNNNMLASKSIANYSADTLGLVNNYYQSKYKTGSGGGITTSGAGVFGIKRYEGYEGYEGFIGGNTTYSIDPKLQSLFFGDFKPINEGQFIAFNDLMINIGYDITNTENANNSTENTKNSNSISLGQDTNIIITITSIKNNLNIIYAISSFTNYNGIPNIAAIIISNQNIVTQPANSQTLQQLLSLLGIMAPTRLIMSYEEFVSTENKTHKTYKLMNDNLDTILVLHKI